MYDGNRSHRHRPVRLALVSGIAGSLAMLAASCIVADPPPDIPAPAPHRPTIEHGSVVPPPTQILVDKWTPDLQLTFDVPVELDDPTSAFEWNVFFDYDRNTNASAAFGQRVAADQTAVDAGVRLVEFTIGSPDPTKCHVIEFIVALRFTVESSHTPDAYGGDSVVWFYNPSGDPSGCPAYDAGGVDAAFPDAGDPGPIIVPDAGGGG